MRISSDANDPDFIGDEGAIYDVLFDGRLYTGGIVHVADDANGVLVVTPVINGMALTGIDGQMLRQEVRGPVRIYRYETIVRH